MMQISRHAQLKQNELLPVNGHGAQRRELPSPTVLAGRRARVIGMVAGQNHRDGWTLVEMLVTIAIMATITGVAVKTLAAMLRSERNGIEHVSRLATVSKLARQFRADIHAATAVELGADVPTKPLLLITVADAHQIQYEKTPQGLLRTERRTDKPARWEPWRLSETEFQCVESTGTPRLLTLVIGTLDTAPNQGTKPATSSKEIRIDAVVGRDKL